MKGNKVGVITLNFNQNGYTIDCVKSILKSEYSNFEVILVENGSSVENFKDLKQKLPEDDRLLLTRLDENIGYVGGVNYGLKTANEIGCDYFLIMNNDTLVDPLAIKELVVAAKNHEDNAIISGKVYNYDEKDTLQYIGNVYKPSNDKILDYKALVKNRREKDTGQFDKEIELAMTDDIMWMIPRKIFETTGYYSQYFFLYGEQTDYALRAKKNGYKLIYIPSAKIWHKGGITTTDGNKQSPRIIYWTTFATLKISVLHFSKKEAKSFFRRWVFRMTVKRTLHFLMGKQKFSMLRAHLLAVKHFRFWNQIRYNDNGYNPF